MASPAPREPTAPPESVLAALAQLDADPKLEGKGLSATFARSFPDLPAEGFAVAATEAPVGVQKVHFLTAYFACPSQDGVSLSFDTWGSKVCIFRKCVFQAMEDF